MALALFSISQFQSTLLMRGATLPPAVQLERYLISIHAPHARSDLPVVLADVGSCAISIHAPHARSDMRRRLS